ncbi:MAG: hypothetical protein ACJ779_07030 [Chloroflexota bacterium]
MTDRRVRVRVKGSAPARQLVASPATIDRFLELLHVADEGPRPNRAFLRLEPRTVTLESLVG